MKKKRDRARCRERDRKRDKERERESEREGGYLWLEEGGRRIFILSALRAEIHKTHFLSPIRDYLS